MVYVFSNLFRSSPIESGTYEGLVDFVNQRNHNGLYVARVDIKKDRLRDIYMHCLMSKLTVSDESFLPKNKGKLIRDVNYDDLNRISDDGDGLIAINRAGEVLDDHRIFRWDMFPEFTVDPGLRTGTGHIAMVTLSLFPYIGATYICSAKKKTVKKFVNGRIRKRYDGPD